MAPATREVETVVDDGRLPDPRTFDRGSRMSRDEGRREQV